MVLVPAGSAPFWLPGPCGVVSGCLVVFPQFLGFPSWRVPGLYRLPGWVLVGYRLWWLVLAPFFPGAGCSSVGFRGLLSSGLSGAGSLSLVGFSSFFCPVGVLVFSCWGFVCLWPPWHGVLFALGPVSLLWPFLGVLFPVPVFGFRGLSVPCTGSSWPVLAC